MKSLELSIKDLTEVKIKLVSEYCDQNLSKLKQEIDQQLLIANENLIKSEEKSENILEIVKNAQASNNQEIKDHTEFKIVQQN